MLELQKYLRNNSLSSLEEKYGIYHARHEAFPNLILFHYNQISSPMGEKIVQEARSIILDESDDWKVIAYPLNKFFNYQEGHAAKIDFTQAEVQDKLDGSCMHMYLYQGQWHIASSGLPDARGPFEQGNTQTFRDLFWETWKTLGYDLPTDRSLTYVFEMITSKNKIICQYDRPRLVLIAVRDNQTFQEICPKEIGKSAGWEIIKTYSLSSLEEILKVAKEFNPIRNEGFVVVQKVPGELSFRRVKIKNPAYVALTYLRSSLSSSERDGVLNRRILEIMQTNESTEFLTYFPELSEDFCRVLKNMNSLIRGVEILYQELKDIPDQKEFAKFALKHPLSGVLFGLRAGKISSAREGVLETSTQKLEKLIES